MQSEVRARDRHSLFLDQFLPPDLGDWDWTSAPRLADVGEQDATLPLHESHALLPSPRAPRTRFSRAAPTPAPGTNLTLLMKQMKDYVEDNMINKDPLFDEKFTEMLEAALGNATESEHKEQRELARTLLQAWKVRGGRAGEDGRGGAGALEAGQPGAGQHLPLQGGEGGVQGPPQDIG